MDDNGDANSLRTSQLSIYSLPSTVSLISEVTITADEPPPYSSVTAARPTAAAAAASWDNHFVPYSTSEDPRVSSTDSLGSSCARDNRRRTLLLVYIHGFMGSEVSFQSFPAHVHNVVSELVSDTHIVHTKVYPRYLSRLPLQAAANDLSQWLTSIEDPEMDVVLLNHSMGGILAAEVALMTPEYSSPTSRKSSPLRHRILGTINFDTPFLGMHPRVFKSGLGNLLRTGPLSPRQFYSSFTAPTTQSESNPSSTPSRTNSLPDSFSAALAADISQPIRTGLNNALSLINKYSRNLKQARSLVASHIEFAGCLFDYEGLKVRYCKIRMLEERDVSKRACALQSSQTPPRIRFANYFGSSTGKLNNADELSAPRPTVNTTRQGSDYFNEKSPPPDYSSPLVSASISQSNRGRAVLMDEEEDEDSDADFSVLNLNSFDDPLDESDDELNPDTHTGSPSRSERNEQSDIQVEATSPSPSTVSSNDFIPQKLQNPLKPPTPPDIALARVDREAYRQAFETYRNQLKEFTIAIKTQHDQDVARLKKAHKEQKQKRKGNFKRMVEKYKEEQKTMSYASRVDRKMMSEAQKSKSKLAQDADKEYSKVFKDVEKEERKKFIEIIRDEGKKMHETAKSEHNTLLDIAKEHRKRIEWAAKLERKANDDKRKMDRAWKKGKLVRSSKSGEGSLGAHVNTSSEAGLLPHAPSEAGSSRTNVTATTASPGTTATTTSKKVEKTFCTLPPRDSSDTRDPTWRRVTMHGVDEIGAHCSLFFPKPAADTSSLPVTQQRCGEHYAGLVWNVANLIESWIVDNMSERLLEDIGALDISR